MQELEHISGFLACATPARWIENALAHESVMLIDHAHCEKKAAMTALNLINHYPYDHELVQKMSKLAREELRHLEQVLKFIRQRGLTFVNMSASRYASGLRQYVRKLDPERLADMLIIGAFIEARSCERFAALAPHLDQDLGDFYGSLLKSESRHYQDYLKLAAKYAGDGLQERIEFFRQIERQLIEAPDEQFRFHSGPLA